MPEDRPDNEEIARRKKAYRELFSAVSSILFQDDPFGVASPDGPDEYEPETSTILPRLRDCRSARDVRRVVHEEFVHWFDSASVGPEETFEAVAEQIWAAWRTFVDKRDG